MVLKTGIEALAHIVALLVGLAYTYERSFKLALFCRVAHLADPELSFSLA